MRIREMSGFARMKRVTDPLDDKAKARIVPGCYVSSGSEHSAHADDDVMTSSELFFGFSSPERNDSDSDCCDTLVYDDCISSCSGDVNRDLIQQIVRNRRDDFRNVLRAHVLEAVQVFSNVNSNGDDNKSILRRNVMAYLRNCGYNAAVCKAKWQSSGGITAGNYEFIDVLRSEYSIRYLIDLDFASEFEIARRTSSYERLIQCLPKVFVGTIEELKQILKVMSDGAKRSLKSRGLLLPPWRKHRFMQNKWLGPHRRTVNELAATFCSSSPVQQSYGVKCSAVGFNAAVNGGGLLFSATARTR